MVDSDDRWGINLKRGCRPRTRKWNRCDPARKSSGSYGASLLTLADGDGLEGFGDMASITMLAQLSVMDVILFVAGITIAWQLNIPALDTVFMAGTTVQAIMLTIQRVVGLFIVIKDPGQPLRCPVTLITLLPQSILMYVILFVAGDTFHLGLLVLIGDMTIFAGEEQMRLQQGELRQTMIKGHRLGPALFAMTLITALTLLPLVGIIETVTGRTGIGRLPYKQDFTVTGNASQILMFPL